MFEKIYNEFFFSVANSLLTMSKEKFSLHWRYLYIYINVFTYFNNAYILI